MPVGSIGVPFYVLLSPVLLCVTGVTWKDIKTFLIVFLFLMITGLFQLGQGVTLLYPLKTIVSFFVISFMILCVSRWLLYTVKNDPDVIFSFFKGFILFQLFLQVIQVALYYLGLYSTSYIFLYVGFPMTTGFYSEPSHVALSLSPFLFLRICYPREFSTYLGRSTFLVLIFIFLISPSTTLFLALVLSVLFKTTSKLQGWIDLLKVLLLLIFSVLLAICAVIYVEPVSSRVIPFLNLVFMAGDMNDINNLSVLVLLKGGQMAWHGLLNYPLGVGLLNMAALNDYSSISFLTDTLYELNADDGSSIAFKLISEYGYLGIFLILTLVSSLFSSRQYQEIAKVLYGFLGFSFVIMCFRGASYYDGAFFIIIVGWLFRSRILSHLNEYKNKIFI